jgi:DNA-binding beta-propeller fold protein YncE
MVGNLRAFVIDLAALSVIVLAWTTARGVEPMPVEKRIAAKVVTTLTAENPAMHMPTDVAVDSKGNVYVADGARDRIVTFSPEFKVRSATTRPAGRQLKRPVGLCVDARDNLWIADTGNHRLLVIGAGGEVVSDLALPKTDAGKDADPTDVVVTADGRRTYVVDNPNHRVLVRDNTADGAWTVLGRPGRGIGQFEYPFMAAIGKDGDVLITEAIGARVQTLTTQDRWAGAVGAWGVELGQFHRPKGVATDAAGRIFVSDSTFNVVQVFDPRGQVEGVLTDDNGRPFYFKHPMGMTFDAKGRLYVVELAANRVAVVELQPAKGKP